MEKKKIDLGVRKDMRMDRAPKFCGVKREISDGQMKKKEVDLLKMTD